MRVITYRAGVTAVPTDPSDLMTDPNPSPTPSSPADASDAVADDTSAANAEFAEQCRQMAEGHAERASEHFDDLDYDFSPASLQQIDHQIEVYHPQGFTLDSVQGSMAAYVGETIRRVHGGVWHYETDGTAGTVRGIAGRATVNPFLWVYDRVEAVVNGPWDDDGRAGRLIGERYAALLETLGLEDQIPPKRPVDAEQLRMIRESIDAGAFDEIEQPDGADESDIDDADLTPEEKQTLIARMPALCFLLVAGCDGSIDKKEIVSFAGTLSKAAETAKAEAAKAGGGQPANRLTGQVFGEAPQRFAEDLDAIISEVGVTAAMLIPLKLMQARQAVLEQHPAEAGRFCRSLYDLAHSVAAASGGFFGFGSKISKAERAALAVLHTALGLDEDSEAG